MLVEMAELVEVVEVVEVASVVLGVASEGPEIASGPEIEPESVEGPEIGPGDAPSRRRTGRSRGGRGRGGPDQGRSSAWARFLSGRDPHPVEVPAVVMLGVRPHEPAREFAGNPACMICG